MKITIRNLQKKLPVYPKRIKKSILRALKKEGVKKQGEITVSFVDDKLIFRLNAKYLKKNASTDVLAFDITDKAKPGFMFADIIVSTDTAFSNAKFYKTSPSDEMNLYSLHGLLHLLGYNDHKPKDILMMRKKEAEYANP